MINNADSKAGPSKPSPLRSHPYPSPSSSAPAHIGSFPSYISKEDEQSHDHDHDDEHEHGYSDAEGSEVDVIPTRVGRKLCVRHKQMANQNVNAKLQKSLDSFPLHERSAITSLWSTFSQAPHNKRKLILEGILTMCCFSQLSHLSDSLNQIIRIDPFSLLPREVNLRILGYLDAISLGRAAQVNKSWKALADDDLLWRRMCGQHIDRKCEKCGWGLPLLERRRLKVELKDRSPAVAFGINEHGEHSHKHSHEPTKLVTRVEALGGKKGPAAENITTDRMSARTVCDPAVSTAWLVSSNKRSAPSSPAESSRSLGKRPRIEVSSDSETETTEKTMSTDSNGLLSREVRLTRPWKTVYCERLVVERNWRKGRCLTKTLKGHKDGVMCLQYHTTLSNPSYPVLITGSYDRTVRVWNLDTGEEVRALHGHTRAVRALQFDQMLLFTGAMDGTVRMWNWRAGECLRVLEGHTDGVVSLNYNGYLLATGSADSTIQVWNFRNGSKFTLRGHEDWVNSVVLWDGKTSPGDIDPTQMPSFTKNHEDAKTSSSTSSDDRDKDKKPDIDTGAMLFSASDDGTVKLWDLTTQQCVRTFAGHKAQIQSMKVLMVDMTDEEIDATSTRSESVRKALTPPTGFVSGANAQLSPSPPMPTAQLALPEGFDPRAHMNSMASRQGPVEPRVYVHPSPDKRNGKASARGGRNKGDGGKEVTGEDGRRKRAILATGSLDGTIKLWCVDSGEEQTTLFGHIEGVWAVDMDALRLASASHDRTIKVWDRESGNCVQTLVGHRGAVTSLQLSDDMIVSGSDDGDVMVWSFAPSAVLPGNPGCGEGTPTPAAIY